MDCEEAIIYSEFCSAQNWRELSSNTQGYIDNVHYK